MQKTGIKPFARWTGLKLLMVSFLPPPEIIINNGISDRIRITILLIKQILQPFLYSSLFLWAIVKIRGTSIMIKLVTSRIIISGTNSSKKWVKVKPPKKTLMMAKTTASRLVPIMVLTCYPYSVIPFIDSVFFITVECGICVIRTSDL